MHDFVKRHIESTVKEYLKIFPAVALLGSRQCGKSTFTKKLVEGEGNTLYLDLQNMDDLNKLNEPMLFFSVNGDKMICLDEIQLLPDLFGVLRVVIDKKRENGKFILLGSASRQLIQQSAESLAGRIGIIELTPFILTEINKKGDYDINQFWFRGGYPDSYLANSDSASMIWCENFIRTYVERDIPQLGIQIPALQIRRMLGMCAHAHGQLFNASKLGESLGLTHPTVKRYLDLLEQTFILRSLLPYEGNIKKRLIKSPKVYVRDSGLLHRLLQIKNFNSLLSNPVFGASWEGFVIENIRNHFPGFDYSFYRSASGNELDLIIRTPEKLIAVECKASTAPAFTKGFWKALEMVKPDFTFVVAPVAQSYHYNAHVIICSLEQVIESIGIISNQQQR
jgi:predicted AAA+ superfamily ATPase